MEEGINEALDYLKTKLNSLEFEAVRDMLKGNNPKLWEITFWFVDNEFPAMACLIMGNTREDAYNSITSVWKPPAPIEDWAAVEKHYFQVMTGG